MSRAGQRERVPQELYKTPRASFAPLLPYLPDGGTVWEPACGDGRLVHWMHERPNLEAYGSDLFHVKKPFSAGSFTRTLPDPIDFLACKVPPLPCTTICTNPPYNLALEFAEQATRLAAETFLLLRLGFLASSARLDFFRANPLGALFILTSRPSFVAAAKCENCGAKWQQEVEEPRVRVHSKLCDGRITYTTTDMADYAWFYWGTRRFSDTKIIHL